MDHRNGKCSQCGAEYKIPASFTHDVARCKECQGVVNVTPALGAAATKSASPPKLVEVEPENAEAKRKARGTLAKLKAQRAAARATGAAETATAATTTSEPDPFAAMGDDLGGTELDSLGIEDAVDDGAAPPEVADVAEVEEEEPAPKPRSRAGSRSTVRSSPSSRPGGRKRGGGRRTRGAREAKPKSKAPLIGGIVGLLVIVGGGAFAFRDSLFGGGDDEVEAASGADEGTDAGIDDTASAGLGLDDAAADAGTGDAAAAPEAEAPEPESPAPETAQAPEPEEPEEPQERRGDPSTVDLDAIEEFGPAPGTTDEEWTEMNELADTFLDLDQGAAGPRAGRKLEEMGRKAFPVLVNRMTTLDYSTEEGVRLGDMCQRALQNICNGTNFDWRYETTPEQEYFNKKVVVGWANTWRSALEDIEVFIRAAKLDDVDPEEANRLRGLYGEPVDDPFGDLGGGFDDDLDVD